jgi:hypothetical protein
VTRSKVLLVLGFMVWFAAGFVWRGTYDALRAKPELVVHCAEGCTEQPVYLPPIEPLSAVSAVLVDVHGLHAFSNVTVTLTDSAGGRWVRCQP